MKEEKEKIILVPKEGYYIPERVIKVYRYQYGFYALGFLIVLLGVYLHRMWIEDTILRYVANAIVLTGISVMLYTYAIVYKVDKAAEKMREREIY
ncbi:MAG: hypothetical protein H5T47_02645 [Archaeoglobi archaeon]|nr:hypothetical protein [Candidatus Mnemosynella bozhongmuii]